MQLLHRIARHLRISWQNLGIPTIPSPPFLTLFITSKCNLRCEHCVYWKKTNKRDDLTFDEICSLSDELSKIENLNISGGEPFLREEFSEICCYFIHNNKVEQIYVPTNAFFTDKIVRSVGKVLQEKSLKIFAIEISLDGMPDFHNRFRGSDRSFQKAMETYDALVKLQKLDSRLRIHAVSTVNAENIDEIRNLTTYLYKRCPAMDHHHIALIRGDRRRSSLMDPPLLKYKNLFNYCLQVWAPREKGRFGSVVIPMMLWAKVRIAEEHKQVVPCRAGVLTAVVYANGDVSTCELRPPLGNLRTKNFKSIWHSDTAKAVRRSISKKECYCTHEIAMWPSITFQPLELAKLFYRSEAWK